MFLYKMERGNVYLFIYLILSCIQVRLNSQRLTSTSTCSLMKKLTCSSPVYGSSCVIGFTDFDVIVGVHSQNCTEVGSAIKDFGQCLSDIRKFSNFISVVNKQDLSDLNVDEEQFPKSTEGLVMMYVCGMLTGILLTLAVVFLYHKWLQKQAARQDNTYLDFDLNGEDEESPPDQRQRGSVAFVREITSVYYNNQVSNHEKDRNSSVKSQISPWSSRKSRMSDKSPSLNKKEINKMSVRQTFSYEQSVPEENPELMDPDSPTELTPGNHVTDNVVVKTKMNDTVGGNK